MGIVDIVRALELLGSFDEKIHAYCQAVTILDWLFSVSPYVACVYIGFLIFRKKLVNTPGRIRLFRFSHVAGVLLAVAALFTSVHVQQKFWGDSPLLVAPVLEGLNPSHAKLYSTLDRLIFSKAYGIAGIIVYKEVVDKVSAIPTEDLPEAVQCLRDDRPASGWVSWELRKVFRYDESPFVVLCLLGALQSVGTLLIFVIGYVFSALWRIEEG